VSGPARAVVRLAGGLGSTTTLAWAEVLGAPDARDRVPPAPPGEAGRAVRRRHAPVGTTPDHAAPGPLSSAG
jgi:hypothetical protein